MHTQALEQLTQLIQFTHPEKILAKLPGIARLDPAPLYDLDQATYDAIRVTFAAQAQSASIALLADPALVRLVDQLPFSKGATVVALGDSITDDYQSWAEILRLLIQLRRPYDGIRIVNAGVSGDTSAQLLARFLAVVELQPEWIICLAGTNDARRHGPAPFNKPVSIEETGKNLEALRSWAAAHTTARWVWMTPPPVISERIAAYWQTKQLQLQWWNDDLEAIAALIRQHPDPVIDLFALFGSPPDPTLLLDDGLHPSLAGQQAITTALVRCLGEL